jgi:hypothetical protein
MSVYLPICLLIFLSICPYVYKSICLYAYITTCLSPYLFICLSLYLSICLSAHMSICLPVYLHIYIYVFLYIYLSVYLSIFCLLQNSVVLSASCGWASYKKNHEDSERYFYETIFLNCKPYKLKKMPKMLSQEVIVKKGDIFRDKNNVYKYRFALVSFRPF